MKVGVNSRPGSFRAGKERKKNTLFFLSFLFFLLVEGKGLGATPGSVLRSEVGDTQGPMCLAEA